MSEINYPLLQKFCNWPMDLALCETIFFCEISYFQYIADVSRYSN